MTMQRFGVECRAQLDGDRIVGHASVFGQLAKLPGHYEQIDERAFEAVLSDDTTDVRALINHDPRFLLARQSSGTLRLDTDQEGLVFDLDLPDTTYANDLRALVARGDMTGASFGFLPGADTWSKAPDGRQLRTHTSIRQLVDVSIVTWPAYEGAGVNLRSIEFGRPVASSNRSRLVRARARRLLEEN